MKYFGPQWLFASVTITCGIVLYPALRGWLKDSVPPPQKGASNAEALTCWEVYGRRKCPQGLVVHALPGGRIVEAPFHSYVSGCIRSFVEALWLCYVRLSLSPNPQADERHH